MNSVLTYVDANVLIAAFRAQSDLSALAVRVLRDPGRAILVSDALWLETIPKATYHRQQREVAFYEGVFSLAHQRIGWSQAVTRKACELAPRYGLAAMGAVHVAAAIVGGADELITGEKWDKPMFRVSEIRVLSLQPAL
jgi:predicted nucleic acid-binding protein